MSTVAPIANQCPTVQMVVIIADLLDISTIMCMEKISVHPGFTGDNVHYIPDKITTKDSIEGLVGKNFIGVRSTTGLGAMLSDDLATWHRDGINWKGFLVRDHLRISQFLLLTHFSGYPPVQKKAWTC